MRFLLSELAGALQAELSGPDCEVDGASIDSRNVASGSLFVPLVAERDGHEFIQSALDKEAAAYLSSRPSIGGSCLLVPDTAEALRELGQLCRDRLADDSSVVGVTGSVGKTSVKDMIRDACASTHRTHASKASFNNEIGLPLTLANAPADAAVTVLEMGARGLGHISDLCEVARPEIGVVTKVALAHSELFGTIETVAKAKSELIEALPSTGRAILNADDPLVSKMSALTSAEVLTFGLAGDVCPLDVELDEQLHPSFTLATPDGSFAVKMGVAGAHMAVNAAAAVAVALSVGVPLPDAVAGVEAVQMSPWRMEVERSHSGLVVVNDAYNANPTSMRAALQTLSQLNVPKKVAVLGEMGELGPEGPEEHLRIASEAAEAGVQVLAIGTEAYGPSVECLESIDVAVETLTQLGDGAVVLVKGSRVAGLERLAAGLLKDGGDDR